MVEKINGAALKSIKHRYDILLCRSVEMVIHFDKLTHISILMTFLIVITFILVLLSTRENKIPQVLHTTETSDFHSITSALPHGSF